MRSGQYPELLLSINLRQIICWVAGVGYAKGKVGSLCNLAYGKLSQGGRMSYEIALKRVYSAFEEDDGSRILVDRLWPRGKERASLSLTEWYRDAAPSSSLRRDYHQQKISEASFQTRYRLELKESVEALLPLMRYARQGKLTLLTAARQLENSHLPLLREALLYALDEEDRLDQEPASSPCFLDAPLDDD